MYCETALSLSLVPFFPRSLNTPAPLEEPPYLNGVFEGRGGLQ